MRERSSPSPDWAMRSAILGDSLPRFPRSRSMEPYLLMSVAAVFSPMPGTPGTLSDTSPQRARMSMNCSARMSPYLASRSCSVVRSYSCPLRLGRRMLVYGPSSCW